jgi:hypothetical protein
MNYEAEYRNAAKRQMQIDPLVLMAQARHMMLSKAAKKYGAVGNFKRDYLSFRDRVRARSYLVDRKPRDFLDAGIMAIAKAQVIK